MHLVLAAPPWLPAEAQAEWQRVHPLLSERGTLTDADLSTLEHYCLAVGQVQECQRALADGLTCTTAAGELKPHPALRIQHAAIAHARALGRQLGITPASRGCVSPADKGESNDWASVGV